MRRFTRRPAGKCWNSLTKRHLQKRIFVMNDTPLVQAEMTGDDLTRFSHGISILNQNLDFLNVINVSEELMFSFSKL